MKRDKYNRNIKGQTLEEIEIWKYYQTEGIAGWGKRKNTDTISAVQRKT